MKKEPLRKKLLLGFSSLVMAALQQGYGRVMTIKLNTKYEDEFKAAEQIAQVNKTGFWQNPINVGWE